MNKNQKAVAIFNKLAKGYEDKYMDVNLYADTFNFFCEHIEEQNPAILEIACGPGNITQYLLEKRPDFKLLGIDLASNMIELAKINNPNANFKVMDCMDIGKLNQAFNAILCGFCLPYLSKKQTATLIKDSSKLLTKGGLLYLSTMEDDYDKSCYTKGSTGDEIFMHYYPAEYLIEVLEDNQFEVLKLDRKSYSERDKVTTDLILIAKKIR